MLEGWNHFWLAPSSAELLGFQRAFFLAVVLADVLRERRWRFLQLEPFWGRKPAWLSPSAGKWLEWIWKLSLLTSCLGLATRFSLFLAALLGFFWFRLPQCYRVGHHRYHVTALALAVLACAPCGDGFSLDAILAGTTPEPGPQYTWPARLICLALAGMLVNAGWTKLRWSGPAWTRPRNLQRFLIRAHALPYDARPAVDWGLRLAAFPWLCGGMALFALLLETLYPVSLVYFVSGWRLLLIFPLGILLLLLGIRLALGPAFAQLAAAHVFWMTPPGVAGGTDFAFWPVLGVMLVVGPGLVAWLFQQEFFPFSHYPMYAETCSRHLGRYCLFGVEKGGHERELWDRGQSALLPLDRWTMSMHCARCRDEEQQQELLKHAFHLVEGNGHHFEALRLVRMDWTYSEEKPDRPQATVALVAERLRSSTDLS